MHKTEIVAQVTGVVTEGVGGGAMATSVAAVGATVGAALDVSSSSSTSFRNFSKTSETPSAFPTIRYWQEKWEKQLMQLLLGVGPLGGDRLFI